MKPNAIGYLSLAKKAGRIEIGEEAVGAAARSGHARLLILANDAPGRALRRARNMVTCTDQQMVLVPFTREELGAALGKSLISFAAITDPALALAFLQALEDPQRYAGALENLTRQTRRVRQRQLEEKAHQRNLLRGKHRHQPKPPADHPKAGPGSPAAQSKRQAKPAAPQQSPGRGPAVRKHGKKSHGGAEL